MENAIAKSTVRHYARGGWYEGHESFDVVDIRNLPSDCKTHHPMFLVRTIEEIPNGNEEIREFWVDASDFATAGEFNSTMDLYARRANATTWFIVDAVNCGSMVEFDDEKNAVIYPAFWQVLRNIKEYQAGEGRRTNFVPEANYALVFELYSEFQSVEAKEDNFYRLEIRHAKVDDFKEYNSWSDAARDAFEISRYRWDCDYYANKIADEAIERLDKKDFWFGDGLYAGKNSETVKALFKALFNAFRGESTREKAKELLVANCVDFKICDFVTKVLAEFTDATLEVWHFEEFGDRIFGFGVNGIEGWKIEGRK